MNKSVVREIIFAILFLIVITYLAFTTNIRFIWAGTPAMWGILLMWFPRYVLKSFTGLSYKKPNLLSFSVWGSIVLFNYFVIYFLFKNSDNNIGLLMLLWLYMGISITVNDLYSIFLERTGKTRRTVEEIKSYLIVEVWFIILLWCIKIGQIMYTKLYSKP